MSFVFVNDFITGIANPTAYVKTPVRIDPFVVVSRQIITFVLINTGLCRRIIVDGNTLINRNRRSRIDQPIVHPFFEIIEREGKPVEQSYVDTVILLEHRLCLKQSISLFIFPCNISQYGNRTARTKLVLIQITMTSVLQIVLGSASVRSTDFKLVQPFHIFHKMFVRQIPRAGNSGCSDPTAIGSELLGRRITQIDFYEITVVIPIGSFDAGQHRIERQYIIVPSPIRPRQILVVNKSGSLYIMFSESTLIIQISPIIQVIIRRITFPVNQFGIFRRTDRFESEHGRIVGRFSFNEFVILNGGKRIKTIGLVGNIAA